MLWVTNHIVPAQEHFASYIIQNKIIARTGALPVADPQQPAIVLFTPEGEHHELPLLFIHYLLRKYGWNTVYLGSNVTMNTLKQLQATRSASYFYLHLITNFTGFLIDDYLETLCHAFPDKKIIASGAATLAMQRQLVQVTVLQTDDAIYRFIRNRDHLGNT